METFPRIEPCHDKQGNFEGYVILWGLGPEDEGGYNYEFHSINGWDRDSLFQKCSEWIIECEAPH